MMTRNGDGTGSDVRRWVLCVALAPLLMGCSATPGRPFATADTVFAAQYLASGSHGALTGEEAGRITDSYQQQIGVASAPPRADTSDTSGMDGGPGAAGVPAVNSALGR